MSWPALQKYEPRTLPLLFFFSLGAGLLIYMSLHDEQYMHLSWLLVSCDGEDPVGFLLVCVCEQLILCRPRIGVCYLDGEA